MNRNRQLVIVSNRLPVSIEKHEESYSITPSSGGLVTALKAVFRKYEGSWIGWPGTPYSPAVEELVRNGQHFDFAIHPVFLTEEERGKFYSGFSNEVVWPLFHDLQSRCNYDPTYWDAYTSINDRFADKISKIAHDNDFIWVHDYHLTRAAASLRRMGLHATLAYFQHIPFPSPDIFEKLPWRTELLTSMLDFDLVGFQTARDQQNFAVCVDHFVLDARIRRDGDRMIIEEESGRVTVVGSFPISIDFAEFETEAASPAVTEMASQIRADMHGRTLALGVDRLDYTKGLPEKLNAFAHALEQYPELRRNISLVQVVVPSREDIPKYQDLKLEIERRISEINGRYTESGWVPIHFIYRSLERDRLLGYYRAAEIALVTPLKDGMNLVAKEYCAAQVDERGALVLSEFAGAASQLECGALLVNPNDVVGVAGAIRHAVVMDRTEKVRRMQSMRTAVRNADVHNWSHTFLEAADQPASRTNASAGTVNLPNSPESIRRAAGTSHLRKLHGLAIGLASAVLALIGKSSGHTRAWLGFLSRWLG
ncbi:MAG TPA: trehalose-6-phosphate synthase [Terriglobales bacterium]|nr:trehalose-6-phosphate synthase [Terriglobales bacterium]